jgi:hypothetical protein
MGLPLAFLSAFAFGLAVFGFCLDDGVAAGIIKVQLLMGPKNCWQLLLCCSLMYVGL